MKMPRPSGPVRRAVKILVAALMLAGVFTVAALAEELDVVAAVVESILNQIFQHFLGEVHVVLEVEESNFWLNHPEFCKVTRSV